MKLAVRSEEELGWKAKLVLGGRNPVMQNLASAEELGYVRVDTSVGLAEDCPKLLQRAISCEFETRLSVVPWNVP